MIGELKKTIDAHILTPLNNKLFVMYRLVLYDTISYIYIEKFSKITKIMKSWSPSLNVIDVMTQTNTMAIISHQCNLLGQNGRAKWENNSHTFTDKVPTPCIIRPTAAIVLILLVERVHDFHDKDFRSLHHLTFAKWQEIQIHFYVSYEKVHPVLQL